LFLALFNGNLGPDLDIAQHFIHAGAEEVGYDTEK
jgi:hypothetical protein